MTRLRDFNDPSGIWGYFGRPEVGVVAELCGGLLTPFKTQYAGQYLRLFITKYPDDPITVYEDGTYDFTYSSGKRTISFDLYVDGVYMSSHTTDVSGLPAVLMSLAVELFWWY